MLKSTIIKKTFNLLTFVMIISLLIPVFAFASTGFSSSSYNGGVVNGTITSNVYKPNGVTVSVYAPNGSLIASPTTATYSTYINGIYTYQLPSTVIGSTYAYVNLLPIVTGSVYQAVYNTNTTIITQTPTPSPTTGTPTTSPTPTVIGDKVGKIDADKLAALLKGNENASTTITGDTALLPASALISGKALTINSGDVSYTLPLDKLNLADLAKEIGIELKDMTIKVELKKLIGDDAKAVKNAADALGTTLLSDAFDFTVSAAGSSGKTKMITSFGSTYISRTIAINGTFDTNTTTGALYDPITKKLSFVPSTFINKDGKTTSTLKRNGNSIYTVVKVNKTFADISAHWAKADIELLANKLVVEGVSTTTFEADRSINRAEFAALVVRSLGLSVNTGSATVFSDVKSDDWYAGVVAAAKKAGIINGYEDGNFRPNATITREELAAMVLRALKFAGLDLTVSASEQASILSQFNDSNAIVWGQAEVAAVIKAGIIKGMDNVTLNTEGKTTRAQSATVLKRALTKVGFIN